MRPATAGLHRRSADVAACGSDVDARQSATATAAARRGRRHAAAASRRPPARPSGRADQDRLHHQVPGRLLRHHGRRRQDVGRRPPRRRGRLRPGQERHRRRGRDRAIESMVTQGVKAIAITPTSPNVQAALAQGGRRGDQGRPHRQRHPGLGRASRRVVATDNLAGGKLAGTWLQDHLTAGAKLGRPPGRARQPVARRPGQRDARRPRDRRRRSSAAARRPTATRPRGSTRRQDILTAQPGPRRRSTGACGPPILGALQAIKNAEDPGRADHVVGFDASPDEVDGDHGRRRGRRPSRSSRPRWAQLGHRDAPRRGQRARPSRPTSTPAPRW